jgi:integrase
MAGRQAKILTSGQLDIALRFVDRQHNATRNRVILLLSTKAGLRAGEIAGLTWPMLLDARGRLSDRIELHDTVAKCQSGRTIPLNTDLRRALVALRRESQPMGPVICSGRGGAMRATSIVNWFATLYRDLGFQGCSSHSGRRTFITRAAQMVAKTGGSLRDVQQLAGHRSIEHTQRYIEGNSAAKRRLVALI